MNPINAKLAPLDYNGGPTLTHALLPGSPAIDAGDPNAPATDQRGYGRIGIPDIGAFEVQLPPNSAPVAVGDSAATTAGTFGAGNVLTNDTDADGNTLTAIVVDEPLNGELELNADGTYTYIPDLGFTGTDSFTYKANDGTVESNVATVTLTVTMPATTLGGMITGGGYISGNNGGKAHFNINVQVDKAGTIKGKVTFGDSLSNEMLDSTSIAAVVVNGSSARIHGTATVNGQPVSFVVDVTDGADTFSIKISDGYTNGPRNVDGGNIQIHK